MTSSVVAVRGGDPSASQRNRAAGDFGLRERAALGDLFDGVAIQVARGEIHGREDARWILSERLIDNTHRLDEVAPVGRSQEAETPDAVPYRDLVGGLSLALRLHEAFDGLTFFGEALLDPGEREGQSRALTLQVAARSSAMNALDMGGWDLAMSASTRIKFLGSSSATFISRSAQ